MGAEKIVKTKEECFMESLCAQEHLISIGCRQTGLKFVTKLMKKIDWNKQVFWLQYPKNQELFNFEKNLRLDGEMFSTIRLQDQVWGINFSFVRFDENGVMCRFPKEVYEINRRQSFRYKLPQNPCPVEFKLFLADFGRMISTEVVDISQGGLSFCLPMGAKAILSLDKRFRDCPIKINGNLFSVDVKLKNLFFQEGKLKVGVSFECPAPSFMTEVQLLVKRGQGK